MWHFKIFQIYFLQWYSARKTFSSFIDDDEGAGDAWEDVNMVQDGVDIGGILSAEIVDTDVWPDVRS